MTPEQFILKWFERCIKKEVDQHNFEIELRQLLEEEYNRGWSDGYDRGSYDQSIVGE